MMSIEDYTDMQRANGLSPHTIKEYRQILGVIQRFKPLEKITKEDMVKFFNGLSGKDSTKNLYTIVIKKFYTDNGKPEIVDWMKVRKLKETLKSDDILNIADINKMIESTDSHYFKALIAFLYESGCRIEEARTIRYKDLQETTDGIIVNIPTLKTSAGYRKAILPFSSQYIRNLQTHSRAQLGDLIFPYNYTYINRGLVEIKKRSGITKPVTFHKFRHAKATSMVREGYNEAIVRKLLGWTATSGMIARYQHLNDTDIIDATLQISGKKKRDEKPPEKLNEAKPLTVIEAAGHLFQVEEDNRMILESNQNMGTVVKELEEFVEEVYKSNQELRATVTNLKQRVSELLGELHGD